VCLSVALSACGTRRPDADFLSANGASQQVQDEGDAGTGGTPGATTGAGTSGGATGGSTGAGTTGTGTGGGSGGTTGTTGAGTTGTSSTGTTGPKAANFASDVGVTATTISLGNVVTRTGGYGPDQFTPFYYGAAAYFDNLNAHGGINGRKVLFNSCDDGGQAPGNQNCVRNFVDKQKVFAFVGNNCLVCDGLTYAAQKGVPSVGGLAIDSRDYSLPHTWRYSGDPYPQNYKIGYNGNLYQGTHQYRYFKLKYNVKKAAVVYYDNALPSKNAGLAAIDALKAEGIDVTPYAENVALPNWDADVVSMKANGITAVWDSIDIGGNQNLCKAIDSNKLVLTAKVSTIAVWSQSVGQTFSYPCRTYIFSVEDPGALTYDQTDNAEIATFRASMKRYFPDRESKLQQWSVDGWGSAMWFTDAALSCGADLTRSCLEKYLNRPQGYTAHGIWWPRNNEKWDFATKKTLYRCIQVDQWSDQAKSFVVRAPYASTCYTTPYLPFAAPS
jgi:branched-chain amino acid transport system substrate-binding protein